MEAAMETEQSDHQTKGDARTRSMSEKMGDGSGGCPYERNRRRFDPAKADRVSAAMLHMEGKLNISELEKAYKGEE